jgi:hypothetical protein
VSCTSVIQARKREGRELRSPARLPCEMRCEFLLVSPVWLAGCVNFEVFVRDTNPYEPCIGMGPVCSAMA